MYCHPLVKIICLLMVVDYRIWMKFYARINSARELLEVPSHLDE